jgi:hypothetical protein
VRDKQTTLPAVSRLAELEAVIEKGLPMFVEVGKALAEIRDDGLYKPPYDTFEDYCHERWGLSRGHAYRQMEAAEVAAVLSPIGDIPNEAQAREFVPLLADPEAMREVYHDLLVVYGKRITASVIHKAVMRARVLVKLLPKLKEKYGDELTPDIVDDAIERQKRHRRYMLRQKNNVFPCTFSAYEYCPNCGYSLGVPGDDEPARDCDVYLTRAQLREQSPRRSDPRVELAKRAKLEEEG